MLDFLFLKNFKKRIIKKKKTELEPQEIFLDSLAQKKEKELGIPEQKLEVSLSKKIFKITLFTFLVIIFFLFAKTFQLQILQKEKYVLEARAQIYRLCYIRPLRGVIYDSNLNQLVWNQPSFDLIVDRRDLPREKKSLFKVLGDVASIIEKSPQELEERIKKSDNFQVLIAENLSHQALVYLETKINAGVLPGFQIERNTVRKYIGPQSLSHIIGYTGKINKEELSALKDYSPSDYIGKTGIEKFYETVLRGKPGKFQIKKDALGRKIDKETLSLPETGKSLVLWLDLELQKKLEDELRRMLREIGSKKAAAVVLNPQTGGVLAAVSIPTFDANLFSQGISAQDYKKITENPYHPLFNRVIAGLYPTGSTIKPLIAAAALQENIISPAKKIYCQGGIQVPNPWNPKIIYRFGDWKSHGWTDMRKAIAESCNVYFYTVGGGYGEIKGLGVERIKKYLQLFGWGKKTGVDIPGEREGLIPDPDWKKEHFSDSINKIWMPGDTYNLSIGQGYLEVTPLQVAVAFSAIANGGKLLRPQIVKEIIDNQKRPIKTMKVEVLRENFIEPENLKVVREGMREAVIYGSSVILKDLPVKAAAKTGTAQSSKKDYYYNWVTVFAPYDNPQIVLTILIEDVKGMRPAALPVAKEVLKWYFTQK
ncbi:penicillin-binding protein 2 [bacterium]|nr:penicillin-binding protein 2 [bacterium]